VPIGEESGPEEVAKLVLYLASDDSRHSTGAEFVVDGGMMA
jgi:3alpha(or 20beta)-hydroxysteroid dehydrogenase